MNNILGKTLLGDSVLDYLICLGVFLLAVVVIKIFEVIILRRLKKFAKKTITTFDDFLINLTEKLIVPFLYFGAFYLCIKTLTLTERINKAINVIAVGVPVRVIKKL